MVFSPTSAGCRPSANEGVARGRFLGREPIRLERIRCVLTHDSQRLPASCAPVEIKGQTEWIWKLMVGVSGRRCYCHWCCPGAFRRLTEVRGEPSSVEAAERFFDELRRKTCAVATDTL